MIRLLPTTIYDCRWYLVINEKREAIEKHMRRSFGPEYRLGEAPEHDGSCAAVIGTGGYIILVDEWEYHLAQQGLLAHECLHAAISTLHSVGFVVDDPERDEPLTYLFQFYFQQCMKLIAENIPHVVPE